ncbi:MAG: redoxin domain-containing protein [Bacteroidota bacterium]
MKPLFLTFFCALGLFTPRSSQAQTDLLQLQLPTVHGQDYALSAIAQQKLSVFFFLAPECPLCENYAVTIKDLRQKFGRDQVSFYGIFAGETYSPSEITLYMARFQLPVKALKDPQYQLTQHFGASVTPEVFVVDPRGKVLYQGKIDNWIAALGKKRLKASRFYLEDALRAGLSGETITTPKTEAVGCLIE